MRWQCKAGVKWELCLNQPKVMLMLTIKTYFLPRIDTLKIVSCGRNLQHYDAMGTIVIP